MTPDGVLDVFEKFEQSRAAILAEEARTPDWKLGEVDRLTSDMDTELHKLEAAELSNVFRELDREEGTIRGALKAAASDLQSTAASATVISNDLTVASATDHVPTLADLFDEALLSGQEDRIRRVGAIVAHRLQTLAIGSSNETIRAGARRVDGEYRAWSAAHPTATARLRDIQERRDRAEATVREKFVVTRQRLRFTR